MQDARTRAKIVLEDGRVFRGASFGIAFYKSQAAAGVALPLRGKIFISVKNDHKRDIVFIAKKLHDLGFGIVATKGTSKVLSSNNIENEVVAKIGEGSSQMHSPSSTRTPMYPAASHRESGENAVVIIIGFDAMAPSKTTWAFAAFQTLTRPS